jgi:uncharacterized protein (TIGR03067 family)
MKIEEAQGRWFVVSVDVDGTKFPSSGSSIVITGNRFVSLGMGVESEGVLELGDRTFDLVYDKGPHAGKTSPGIYEVNGGEWKLCLGLAGASRPEGFVTRQGSGHALQVLRRGPEVTVSAAENAPDKATELEGEWEMTSCVQDGQPMPKNFVKYARRIFAGNRTKLLIMDKVSAESRIRTSAGRIDYLDLGQSGRYERSGDTLRIWIGDVGAAPGGPPRTVTEWKRRSA